MSKQTTVPGTLTVSRSVLINKVRTEDDEASDLEVRVFETTPATVDFVFERVANIGNYNSVRLRMGVTVPCYVEEIGDIQKELRKRIPARVDAMLEEWLTNNGHNIHN